MVLQAVLPSLRNAARKVGTSLLALTLSLGGLAAPSALLAQDDGFGPAARVNDKVITRFELDQRIAMMQAFRQPGDIPKIALQTLIDDALRRDAADAAGVRVSAEEVQAGMQEFASRTSLPFEEFMAELDKAKIAPETLRDFVEAGLLWRSVVRQKYAASTRITEAEVDRAIGAGAASGGELRVLLSEIVLPTDQGVDAMALAERIHLMATNSQRFSMAARDYSKAPTAGAGGRLGWLGVEALPKELAPSILALKVGEMTPPIVLGQTVQIFFLRDISQAAGEVKGASQVEYARMAVPAGLDLAKASASLDTCDDLYDLARGLGPDAIQRATLAEAALPADLGTELARMDPGETLVRQGANGAVLIMLCSRAPASLVPPSRDDVRESLLNARLALLATTWLEELRSNAILRLE